jgi:hypothetical protein
MMWHVWKTSHGEPSVLFTQRGLRRIRGFLSRGTPLEVSSIALSGFRYQFGAEGDGVFGMDVLARYSLRLELRNQRLDLLPFGAAVEKRGAPAAFDFAWTSELRRILFPAQLFATFA